MSEYQTVNYDKTANTELDLSELTPVEGKILLQEYRPPEDAVYFQDNNKKIIAYLTYKPYWGNPEEMVVESFTNEAYRQKGLQERLSNHLIRMLRNRGCKTIVGQIMMDNSRSFLNRLSTKDPETNKVLKAEIDRLDSIDVSEPVKPHYLDVRLDLNQTVESNRELLQKIIELQQHLTEFRMGPPISDLLKK